MKPLVLSGTGLVSPLGVGAEAVFEALLAGQSGFSPAPAIEKDATSGWAARIPMFNASPWVPPMRARRLDRGSLFAVAAARQALEVAGLASSPELEHELAVVVGTSSAGSGPVTVFLDALFRHGPEAAPPVEFPNTVMNAPASHVSIELGLKGPNLTLSHSEAVIAQALLLGRLMMEDGRATRLLVGAVDEWNAYYQAGYGQLGAIRDQPTGGGGTLLGEGSAMLVLESPELAAERGAEILTRVLGVAVGTAPGDAYRWVANATVLERVIRQALADAGLGPGAVGSVWLGANGVLAMEEAEAEALSKVFAGFSPAATGLKGAIGERAVSGATTLALAALARKRGELPPFAGGALARWPQEIRLSSQPAPSSAGATLVVLYGFGGNFGAVLLG